MAKEKTKAFWKSKTVLFAAAGLAMALFEFYGLTNEVLAVLAFAGTLYGRFKAEGKLAAK